MADTKDTIYVDIDDEITSIIDKVSSSKHKIVALVLPKRAAMLQSIVNMKLLKRSGDAHKKNLVLITSEAGLLPLAGAVKLHVAKTLQSKPAIPAAPKLPSDDLAVDDDDVPAEEPDVPAADLPEDLSKLDDDIEDDDPALDAKKSVGELAGVPAAAHAHEETIELDDDPADVAPDPKKPSKKAAGGSKNKLKIPNFDQFRTRLLLGGGALLLLIIFWFMSSVVLPTAKITVKTDDISVNTNVAFTANTDIKDFDAAKGLLPATQKQTKKTDAEKITATGQKNVGEKASGSVTMKLTNCAQDSVTVPSGTAVTNGTLTFVTQADVTFNSVKIGNQCKNESFPSFTTGTVRVVAQNPGDQYNINGGRVFSVAGYSNVSGTDSSSMSGGTNKNVTVVSDADVDAAKQKLNDRSKAAAMTELKKQFDDARLFTLVDTFGSDNPAVTAAPAVGQEASEVTVTSIVTYSMLGVKRDDLKTMVVNAAKKQIDTSKQSIGDDGLSKAVFKVGEKKSPTDQVMSVQSTVSTGAQVDQDALKKELAGKKKGEVQQIIGTRPSVKEVNVKYSPFWVYKTPSNPKKITITFEQVNASEN